jgi:hypothetical protein
MLRSLCPPNIRQRGMLERQVHIQHILVLQLLRRACCVGLPRCVDASNESRHNKQFSPPQRYRVAARMYDQSPIWTITSVFARVQKRSRPTLFKHSVESSKVVQRRCRDQRLVESRVARMRRCKPRIAYHESHRRVIQTGKCRRKWYPIGSLLYFCKSLLPARL